MPAAHNSPGFVSFTDYLNANQGALDAERQGNLGAATAAGDKAVADLAPLGQAAYGAGQQAAGAHGAFGPDDTIQAGGFDPSTTPGMEGFLTDRQKALDATQALTNPYRAGDKASPWESGLVNASTGYQTAAKGLQDHYASALSNYLGPLGDQFSKGFTSSATQLQRPTTYPGEIPTDNSEHMPFEKPRPVHGKPDSDTNPDWNP